MPWDRLTRREVSRGPGRIRRHKKILLAARTEQWEQEACRHRFGDQQGSG